MQQPNIYGTIAYESTTAMVVEMGVAVVAACDAATTATTDETDAMVTVEAAARAAAQYDTDIIQ